MSTFFSFNRPLQVIRRNCARQPSGEAAAVGQRPFGSPQRFDVAGIFFLVDRADSFFISRPDLVRSFAGPCSRLRPARRRRRRRWIEQRDEFFAAIFEDEQNQVSDTDEVPSDGFKWTRRRASRRWNGSTFRQRANLEATELGRWPSGPRWSFESNKLKPLFSNVFNS